MAPSPATPAASTAFPVVCDGQQNQVGWAIDAGVKFNLQGWGGMFGAGDDLIVTGVYTQSAVWYSGLPGRDVGRERPDQRQRSADVSR